MSGLSVCLFMNFVRVKCKFICYSPGTPDPQLMTLWYNLVKCLFRFELLLFVTIFSQVRHLVNIGRMYGKRHPLTAD